VATSPLPTGVPRSYCQSDTNGDCNRYANADTGPNHIDCAGLLSRWETESGLVVERRDFEPGRRFPQRRVDPYDQERRVPD
jgi:hypothetical protein